MSNSGKMSNGDGQIRHDGYSPIEKGYLPTAEEKRGYAPTASEKPSAPPPPPKSTSNVSKPEK